MMKDKSCKTPRWRILKSQLNNLSQEGFKDKMTKEDCVIIDVRTEQEFLISHITGAINIDYFDEILMDKLQQIDQSKAILVYCRTGRRSIRVCTLMKNGGFDSSKIYNLEEGFSAWIDNFPALTTVD